MGARTIVPGVELEAENVWDLTDAAKPIASVEPGRKYDGDKPRYDLIPWEVMEGVARVLGYGARKYAPDNWVKVPDGRRRYFAAALRHLFAWWRGEIADPETGESHLAHALCCVLFLGGLEAREGAK